MLRSILLQVLQGNNLEDRLEAGLLLWAMVRPTLASSAEEPAENQSTRVWSLLSPPARGGKGHVVTIQTAAWMLVAGDDIVWEGQMSEWIHQLFSLHSGLQQGQGEVASTEKNPPLGENTQEQDGAI